jgi:hypothetical protein
MSPSGFFYFRELLIIRKLKFCPHNPYTHKAEGFKKT